MAIVRMTKTGVVGYGYSTEEAFYALNGWQVRGWVLAPEGTIVWPQPYILSSEKGAPLGVATLDAAGVVVQGGGGTGGALTTGSVQTSHLATGAVTADKADATIATQSELDVVSFTRAAESAATNDDVAALTVRVATLETKLTGISSDGSNLVKLNAATKALDLPMVATAAGTPAAGLIRLQALSGDKSLRITNPDGKQTIAIPSFDTPSAYAAGGSGIYSRTDNTAIDLLTVAVEANTRYILNCLLYTSPSPRDS